MKKLLKLILIAIFLGIHPVGCIEKRICGDLGNSPRLVRITGMDYYLFNLKHLHKDVYMEVGVIEDSNYYHPDSVGIGFGIGQTATIAYHKKSNFSFSQTAIACSPAPPNVQNHVVKVDIIYTGTPILFNDSIGTIYQGDTLSSLFKAFSRDIYNSSPSPLSDQESWEPISNRNLSLIKLVTYNRDTTSLNIDAHFYLADGDDLDIKHIKLNLLPYKP